jgi:hypothetical protein
MKYRKGNRDDMGKAEKVKTTKEYVMVAILQIKKNG